MYIYTLGTFFFWKVGEFFWISVEIQVEFTLVRSEIVRQNNNQSHAGLHTPLVPMFVTAPLISQRLDVTVHDALLLLSII